MARSNSANAPAIRIIVRAAGVVVPAASVRLRNPALASPGLPDNIVAARRIRQHGPFEYAEGRGVRADPQRQDTIAAEGKTAWLACVERPAEDRRPPNLACSASPAPVKSASGRIQQSKPRRSPGVAALLLEDRIHLSADLRQSDPPAGLHEPIVSPPRVFRGAPAPSLLNPSSVPPPLTSGPSNKNIEPGRWKKNTPSMMGPPPGLYAPANPFTAGLAGKRVH